MKHRVSHPRWIKGAVKALLAVVEPDGTKGVLPVAGELYGRIGVYSYLYSSDVDYGLVDRFSECHRLYFADALCKALDIVGYEVHVTHYAGGTRWFTTLVLHVD